MKPNQIVQLRRVDLALMTASEVVSAIRGAAVRAEDNIPFVLRRTVGMADFSRVPAKHLISAR